MRRSGARSGRVGIPSHPAPMIVTFLLLLLPLLSCYRYLRRNGHYEISGSGASVSNVPKQVKRTDITALAHKRCHTVFTALLSNGKTLTVLASPGFHLDGALLLQDCNRIIKVIDKFAPKPFSWGFRLYYLHIRHMPLAYRWSFPVGQTISYMFVFGGIAPVRGRPIRADGKGWTRTNGECAIGTLLAHEATHRAAVIYYHRKGGWFTEGLAEYVSYLVWKGHATLCPSDRIDPTVCIRAFADPIWRGHLWQWNFPNAFWTPPERAPLKGIRIDSRPDTIAPDYTTALGAFLYLEHIEGRQRLERIVRRLLARHAYQGKAFYSDLDCQLGFDIRKVTTAQIKQVFRDELDFNDSTTKNLKGNGRGCPKD